MDYIIEECPVCEQLTLTWKNAMYVECTNCKWFPISIPWDEDDYKEKRERWLTNQK